MSDDFLAREAAVLGTNFSSSGAGLGGAEIDFDRAASAFPELDLDSDVPAVPVPSRGLESSGGGLTDGFGAFEGSLPSLNGHSNHNVKVTGGDDVVHRFESEFPPVSNYEPPFIAQPQSRPSFQTPIYQAQVEDDEPEVIRQWRERQEEAIRRRDESSAQKKHDTIKKAEAAIDEFYKEYNSKTERTIKENKEAEAEFLSNLESSLSTGTTWSRICDIIELQNSQSKTIARAGPGTTDLTRYKEVLLRLKREGESAPGAAGY
ncbi:hypothetical protein BS47DRAFT_1375629 [Hydnum rufescens UP504]|uniref:Clathrin light chain n=1 Tax=Hydnum rufescens UP504 TaxID=1448309 RepID=A0A9P6B4B9_9AGAM|nr:hypothetical protein BS47DRAFT_1375629 [Hydnum rufescens UP504]